MPTLLVSDNNFFGALGIDWRSLLLDTLAFLIIAWIVERFIFPTLVRALDRKKHEIESAAKIEQLAKIKLEQAEEAAVAVITKAQSAANEITVGARREAESLIGTAKRQAEIEAQRIAKESEQSIARDVRTARQSLKSEMIALVAATAGTVIDQKLDSAKDKQLIERSLSERSS